MAIPLKITNGIWGEFSPDGTKLAFSRFSTTDLGADGTGTFQLYVADADGSNETCISSSIPTTHVGMASWHASGDWLVVSREMDVGYDGLHFNAHPGKGIFVNLWAVRPDGTDWTQLTDYATTRDGSPMHSPIGALQARFNDSGDKLAWTRKIGTDVSLPFAYWDIAIAEFSLPGDVPTLSSETNTTPGSATFYEVWGWTHDGTKLVIATDVYSVPLYLNVCLLAISGGTIEMITGPNRDWDEQSFISPDGTRIAVTTTRGQTVPYDPIGDWWGTINNDIWIMDADAYGTNAERLTYLNDPDHWMYYQRADGITVRATANQWTLDGKLLINVVQNLGDTQYHELAELWVIEDLDGAQTTITTEVVLPASADAFITNITPTTNYGSNVLLVDGDSSAVASAKYRTAMKFDLSSIPAGSEIVSASLRLYEHTAYNTLGVSAWDVELFKLLVDWNEAQITWNVRQTGVSWSTAGASEDGKDIDATPFDTLTLDGVAQSGFVEWSGVGLLELVQAWVDGSTDNYGFMLAALDAESMGVAARVANLFHSSEATVSWLAPRLVVTYYEQDAHEASASDYLDLLDASNYGFTLRFESVDPDTLATTDITNTLSVQVDSFWYGERQDGIYGWSVGLSGTNYDRVLISSGNIINIYRRFTIDSVPVDDELLWFQGYVMPGEISVDYAFAKWSVSVVDILTYLSVRQAPVFAIGQLNVAEGASVVADSEADPRDMSDEGEFIGLPPLSADQAVDGDLSTLWISGKAPASVDVPIDQSYYLPFVSEVFTPGFGLDRQLYQWIEICVRGGWEDDTWYTWFPHRLRIMTRYGICDIPDFRFGEPYGPETDPNHPTDTQMRFALIGYNQGRFEQLFGAPPSHAPFYQTPYSSSLDWGFNLDGNGDYIALHAYLDDPAMPIREGHQHWVTMYVEAGSNIGDVDTGTVDAVSFSPGQDHYLDLSSTGNSYAENELANWFIQVEVLDGRGNANHQRMISRNDATDAGVTRVYVSEPWFAYYGFAPQVGDSARLTPYPSATPWEAPNELLGPMWPLGDTVPPPENGASNRNAVTGIFNGAGSWYEDETPQPGWSGIAQDATLWPWIRVSPQEMSFALTSPLDDAETIIYLGGTDGLTETGSVFIGGVGPLEYVAKGVSTLTLADAWSGGTVPIGTLVYQANGTAIQPYWPIKTIRTKRRQVLTTVSNFLGSDPWRTIRSLRIFFSNMDSPRDPGADEDWRDDWIIPDLGFNNNTQFINTWNLPDTAPWLDEDGYLRVKHILFAIKWMSDESNGRINEIELIPGADTITGSSANLTVAGFFRYVLETMGIEAANIQTGNASTEYLGSFSTDTSKYVDVLSDLALRTGQVVWPGPKEYRVRISHNPNWPGAPATAPYAYLSFSNLLSVKLKETDNRSISQVVVTLRDQDGNTAIGQFPPLPRSDGEVYIDRQIYYAPLDKANDVARAIYWKMVSDKVEVVTKGPAPWARPGEYTVVLDWTTATGIDLYGTYVIKSVQHTINFGGSGILPRQFVTTLELERLLS